MATENPMRWPPPRGTAAFTSSTTRVVADELELLLRGHNVDRDQRNVAPNRSGSAPPSMEGTFVASGNLVNQQLMSDSSLAAVGNNWRSPSVDNRGSGSMYISTSSLSTHAEEPEDDRTPKGVSDDRERSSRDGKNTLSFSGRHKSLVDLIQEGFPQTTSPVFSQNRSSSHVGEPFIHDMQSLSLGSGSNVHISPGSTATNNPSAASMPINSCFEIPGRSLSPQKDEITSKDACFASDCVSGGTTDSDASRSHYIVEDVRHKRELRFDKQNELHPPSTYSHPAAGYHVPSSQAQGTFQQAHNNYGHFDINSVEMQPLPHAPGVPPPLYASTPAYMAPGNSLYANFNASGLYTPHYGGYPVDSSFLPPYLAGYPPQTGFSLHFNANSGQSFSSQSPGIPTGESFSKGSAMQNLNRFHGQYGLTMPPTFPDPLSLQYFQQTMQEQYGVPVQDHLASAGSQKFQFPPSGSVDIPSARRIRVPSTGYLSSPTGSGFVPQFLSSPLGSSVLPDSPVGSASSLGRQYDFGISQSTARNVGGYARFQGQKGLDTVNDYRKHSFLEELKASSASRIDLSDIVGRIVEFSIDQHGSRFIQQKLENCSVQEKESVFKEVLPHASKLITDVFGNYVIQKFFEYGTFEQRKQLAYQLTGQMLTFSLQMYGCRVIQKALEVIEVDQKTELVHELDGHVMRCVRDQNGNHVIQKCIECLPTEKIDFIITAFQGQVAILSTHPYGCRVIQRVLEHCSDNVRCRSIVDEILESAHELARDQYGNYVTQHVLERGKPFERSQIIRKLSGKVVQMSQHKYASNVVEKCLEFGDASERDFLIEEILVQSEDNDNLLVMMKDQFANYVVQKILEISNDKHREMLLHRIRLHLIALKKYTYGKHIAARFEQLCAEDNETSEP